jgi:hypothetical protein
LFPSGSFGDHDPALDMSSCWLSIAMGRVEEIRSVVLGFALW